MKKQKKLTKRIIAIASIVMIFVLTVAPLSVSAALVNVADANDYWGAGAGNMFLYTVDTMFGTNYPLNKSYTSTAVTSPSFPYVNFQQYIPSALETKYYDEYNIPGCIVTGSFSPNYPGFIADAYIYVKFSNGVTINPGETLEFFVSCYDNTFVKSNTGGTEPEFVYFNYLSDVQAGEWNTSTGDWTDSGIITQIERYVGPIGTSQLSNMARVRITNSLYSQTSSFSQFRFKLRQSTSTGEPALSTDDFQWGGSITRFGFLLSPVVRYDYNFDEAVLDGIGNIENILGGSSYFPAPDYGDYFDDFNPNQGQVPGEDQAIQDYENMVNSAIDLVTGIDMNGGASLWQGIFNQLTATTVLPYVGLMSVLTCVILISRALIGR